MSWLCAFNHASSCRRVLKGLISVSDRVADNHKNVIAAFFMLNFAVEVLFEWMRREVDDLLGVLRAAEPL